MWFYIQKKKPLQFKPKILRCQQHFTYSFLKTTQMTKSGICSMYQSCSMRMNMVAIMNKHNLHYQKVVILPVFSHYTSPIHLHPPLFFLSKFSSAHQTVKYRLAISRLFHQQPSTNQRLGYSNEIISQFLVLSASMSELLIARKINSLDEVVKASRQGRKRSFTI